MSRIGHCGGGTHYYAVRLFSGAARKKALHPFGLERSVSLQAIAGVYCSGGTALIWYINIYI